MSGARGELLRRIRTTLTGARRVGPPEDRRVRPPEDSRADTVGLFTERVADHRASVRHVGADELGTAVAVALWGREAKRIVVPADLPYGWLAELENVRALVDRPSLGAGRFDGVDGVVTGCAVAIAATGTIVLDGGRAQGRRALALLPGYHLCVVHADQIVDTVGEAVARLDPCRPLTWISGPSAVDGTGREGVEESGAGALEVFVVED